MRYAHSLGSMAASKLEGKLNSPLDYINIVLQIIENILTWADSEDETLVKMPYLLIVIDKKIQRAYLVKEVQIVSFLFPFNVYCKIDKATGAKFCGVHYRDINVDAVVLSECRSIYNDVDTNKNKTYQEISASLNTSDPNVRNAIRLYEALMLMEPGYIRYDYDRNGEKGQIHPLNHLDINYVKTCHYKLGLHERLSIKHVEDILNTDTRCWYLAKYKESKLEIQKRLKFALGKKRRRNGK